MSEELQEVKKYYELMNYKDSKAAIKANANQIVGNFVAIGYYLKHIRDKELYVEDGYQNIWDMAQSEFGFSQSWASRCMSVNDRFSKDGNSPILLEKYRGFDKSKLSEMLTLTDQQLEQVTITTTVAEIKNIKHSEKSYATSHKEPEVVSTSKQLPKVCKWDGKSNCVAVCNTGTDCCNECKDHGYCNGECGWQDERIPKPSGKCIHRPEYTCTLPEGSKIAKGDGVNCNSKCCWNCEKREGCGYQCNSSAHRPAKEYANEIPDNVNDQSKNVDNKPEIVNGVDETPLQEKECSNCRYNIMSRDEYFSENPDAKEFPCDTCGAFDNWEPEVEGLVLDCFNHEDGWHKEIIIDEPEEIETVEADIIQTHPVEHEDDEDDEPIDYEKYTWKDVDEELDRLMEYVEAFRKDNSTVHGRRKGKMRYDAMVLLDKEMQKPPVVEPPKPIQPELPIMKNNDQRKEWAENYKAWGEWYYDEHIDCHYYKYDFSNGDRLVVEEYLNRCRYWGHESDNAYYHLLQINKQAYEKNRTFEQKYVHETTSITEIVDYLKDLQKKGA